MTNVVSNVRAVAEKLLAIAVVGMALGLVQAETYDASTGYVTLKNSDSTKQFSLSGAGGWSDEKPPHDTTNYYVKAGWYVRAEAGAFEFPARMVLDGYVVSSGRSSAVGTFSHLQMRDGSSIQWSSVPEYAGWVEIVATDPENPAKLLYTRGKDPYTYSMKMGAKVTGTKDAQLQVGKLDALPNATWLEFCVGSDWTGYYGMVSVVDGHGLRLWSLNIETPAHIHCGTDCVLSMEKSRSFSVAELTFVQDAQITQSGSLTVAGTFNTGTNAMWKLSSSDVTSKFGTLILGDGSTVASDAATSDRVPELFVTNRLEIGRNVSIVADGLVRGTGTAVLVCPFIRLSPEAVAAGLPNLAGVKVQLKASYCELPHAFLAYRDDLDVPGGKVVVITHRPIICTLAGGDEADKLKPDADANLNWEEGVFPQAGYDFFATNALEYTSGTVSDFPGDTLTVADNVDITVRKNVTLTNLFLYGRATLYMRGANIHLGGKYTWYPRSTTYPGYIQTFSDYTAYADAELCGSGDVSAHNYYPNKTGCTLYLTGLNTNWTGGLQTTIRIQTGSAYVADDTNHERIIVSDERNLGAPLAAFRHDALWLRYFSELRTTNTMALPANRGVYIDGNGALTADAGMRLTCGSPLTLNGRLRKAGEGTLDLAGGIRYGLNDDLADTTAATDGNNVIRVDAGDLKVAQAEGVAFDLAAGARVLVDAETGPLTDTTAALPFKSDDGLVRIAPDAATMEKPEHELVLPLLKVSSAAADAIDAVKMLQVKSAWKGVKCTSVVRSDANGVATYTGTFEPVGLLLIFR